MEVITRQRAFELGRVHYFTGKPCGKGHVGPRYVSTGGCVTCLRPFRRMRNAFDKNAVPFVPQRLWVRGSYTDEQRAALNVYLQQCIDTFDRSTCPNDAPLMYAMPPAQPITISGTAGFEALPGLDTLPSADRGPGRPRSDDRCEHGVDKGFCEVCDE